MTVAWRPVQWNRTKLVYDAALVVGVTLYVIVFLRVAPMWLDVKTVGGAEMRMRALGSCAYVMLHLILCIGPLARLDRRFLPLLYNRRHFGVALFFVALAHALYVIGWYQAFSPIDRYTALLISNVNVTSFIGFPIEYLGIAGLLILFVLAATSHDFWLRFLGPPLWKAIHMLVYVAWGLLVMHVVLGLLQSEHSPVLAGLVIASAGVVIVLHLAAGIVELRSDRKAAAGAARAEPWIVACRIDELADSRGIAVLLPDGERAAVFRHGNRISAISNACGHQNGPLAEGRIIDGCVTCPWHGFQYDPETGRAPAPFTDRVPTYRVSRSGDTILIDPNALPPGTPTAPVILEAEG